MAGRPAGAIDVHTHYLAGALAAALERREAPPRIVRSNDEAMIEYGRGNAHPLLSEMTDLELQRRQRAEAGIETAVLSVNLPGVDWFRPADGAAVAREANDELAEICRRGPGRLAALAVLPMQAPEKAAAELERAAEIGLRGAMIYSNVAGQPIDPEPIADLLDVAAERELPLMIHPTYPLSAQAMNAYALIPAVGFLVDTTVAVLRLILGGAYAARPGLRLVLCHAGSLLPQLAGRVDYEAERHNADGRSRLETRPSERLRLLYTDTVCAWPPALRSALELFGPDRLMFGSDYPFWAPARSRETLAGAGLPADVVARIERGNAERLLGPLPA
jgi:aminocarboxymuconate-semialdehyde decarboxylase